MKGNESLDEKGFLVLNYMDIFKFVTRLDSIQRSTGLKTEEIKAYLSKFVDAGLVIKETINNGERWKITPLGEGIADSYRKSLLASTGLQDTLAKKFEQFELFYNAKFKELVTKWQVKGIVEGIPVINDHSDPEYDSAILKQIFDLHEKLVIDLEEVKSVIPQFERYIRRLDFAIERLRKGELDYLIKNEESYHNVWFEMHECILKFWGKERVE